MRSTMDYAMVITLIGFVLVMCGTGCFLMWQRDRIMNETLNIFQYADNLSRKILSMIIHRNESARAYVIVAL